MNSVPGSHTNGGAGTFEEAHHELYKVAPEVNPIHLALTLISVFTLFFGLFSAFVKERLFVGEAIVATAVGIAFGQYGANLVSPRIWGGGDAFDDILLEFTRIVIALSVFAVGVELPRAYVLRHWRSLVFLLGPVMLVGWFVVAGLMVALIPGLNFLHCLVIAACLTPTDPILAASVVGKGIFAQKHVPAHIRHVLQAESGCNDGAAFPFLYLALFLVLKEAVGYWILLAMLYQIILGVVIGSIVGILARKILKFSKRRRLIDRESMIAMYIALALFTTGGTALAGSDDLLAAFCCGAAFAWDDFYTESIEDSNFSNVLDLLVNCTTFFVIGATMPFSAWQDDNLTITVWRLVVLAILILLLRRPPVIFLLQSLMPDCHTKREALFIGHFGPMGVGALFIATLAATKLPTPVYPPETPLDLLALTIQPVVYFMVLCSIIVHGLSIPFFSLGRRVHSISRTWTSQSGMNNEPSWLSRVRRVGDPHDVEVNRDDNGLQVEKNDSQETSDTAYDRTDSGAESEKRDSEKQEQEAVEARDYGFPDTADNATKELVADDCAVIRQAEEEGAEVWDEGDAIVIERNSGEDIIRIRKHGRHEGEYDHDDSATGQHEHRQAHEDGDLIRPASRTSQHSKLSQLSKRSKKSTRASSPARPAPAVTRGTGSELDLERGSPANASPTRRPLGAGGWAAVRRRLTDIAGNNNEDSGLQMSQEDIEAAEIRRQEKKKEEDAYRKERVDCRTSRREKGDSSQAWVQGRQIVIERGDGDECEVIDLEPDADAKAKARKTPGRMLVELPHTFKLGRAESHGSNGSDEVKAPARKLPEFLSRIGRGMSFEGQKQPVLPVAGPSHAPAEQAMSPVLEAEEPASAGPSNEPSPLPTPAIQPVRSDPTPRQRVDFRRQVLRPSMDDEAALFGTALIPRTPPNGPATEEARGRRSGPPSAANSRRSSPSRSLRFELPNIRRAR